MADLWQFQTNFNRGELDPRIVGRHDLAAYYNGMRTGLNVLCRPQGGAKKRPGMQFINEGLGDGRIEQFAFNLEQTYLLVFTAGKMEIYKDNVLQTNINGSGNDFLTVPWTLAQLADIDYIQSADTAIIVHPDVQPRAITRTSDTAWSATAITFTNIPQFDFNDGSSPTPSDEVQRLTLTNQSEGDRFKLSLEGILTDEIYLSSDNSSTSENVRIALQGLPNTGNTGISVVTTSPAPNVIIDVTFSGDSAKDWELMVGTAIFSLNVGFVIQATRTSTGAGRSEDTWSGTRGWPQTATFHESRLWFGGSKSRPATLFGSRSQDFFNFENVRSRDDEAIEATLDTDQVNSIEAVFSNRALQVFTSGGEFFVPDSPITPSSIAVSPQSNLGSKRVRPVTIDGVTLFVQRTGKAINQFQFINELQANQSSSVSVIAQSLIKNPIKIEASRGTVDADANYVYILNDDGTLTVYNTLIAEDVNGFTRWETEGDIRSIAVVDTTLYFLVKRTINSVDRYYIEVENDALNTDSSVLGTGLSSDTLTGLSHLNGETVKVKADGAVQADEVVSGGQITIVRDANTIEAGLEYLPLIKTMPLNVNLQNGPNAAAKKRITRVSINAFESNGILVNGQRLADKTIGQDQFDAPEPWTGIRRVFVHGWTLEADIEITQTTPMPMEILSVGMEVKT